MRTRARCGTVGAMAAIGCLLAVPAALAQDVRITAPAPSYGADPTDDPDLKPLTPEESDAARPRAAVRSGKLHQRKPPTLHRRSSAQAGGLDVKRDDKPDGSSTVALKHPLAIDDPGIESNVGADVNLAAPPPSVFQPGKPPPGAMANDTRLGGRLGLGRHGQSRLA